MMEKEVGLGGEKTPAAPDDPSKSDHEDSDFDKVSARHMLTGHQMAQEEEELDEFGLPMPKIIITSRADSSRSASFESARESIREDVEEHAKEDEQDEADVEDNDVEEHGPENPGEPIEWPRKSGSTLPAAGHVKSSPFHTTPTKAPRKLSISAERAKDLVNVAPVTNSVFKKKQESPVATSKSPTMSPTTPTTPTPQASEPPPHEQTLEDVEKTAIIVTPPENQESTSPKATEKEPTPTRSRNPSDVPSANLIFEDPQDALNPSGASEWSHQMAVIQAESHGSPDKSRKSFDNDGWQTMEAYASYDLYDDETGKLVAKQFTAMEDDEQTKGGAGKGYTRMNQDEDAQSADSMDENTQYLFQESLDDENAKTPLSQMQATKELLTEGQRIAYVGLCKLTMVGMLRDVGRVRFKENRAAYESMTLWSQKMMLRLFSHMDISSAEQIMIEQLAEHGVIPADLIPPLMANVVVANPLFDNASDASSISSRPSMQSARSSSMSESSSPPPVQDPSTLTSKSIPLDLRWTILCDLFLVLIADSFYDARSRVLLERMGAHLNVDWLDTTRFERRVTEALQIQEASEQNWKEDMLIETRAKQARNRRYMMMGLATLGGGLVIGLSAGLLAPVIGAGLAAGFTTVGIGGTSGFLAGTGGAALITSGGVLTGSSIAGRGMAKRTQNVKTFEFKPLHNNQRVNLLVTVSGWMSSKEDDVRLPFSTVDPVIGDIISLLWEPETLQSMGQTMNLLATEILTQSLQQVLGQTVLIALMSSIQWPVMLTKLSYLIDNPWSTSLDRARSCGLLLADCLINRHLGQRPVSLAGYSLGARVIYYCLLELAKAKAYGLVQDIFLFGAPVLIKQKECLRAQSVVAGRFVNGYKSNDWILGYLFRATSTGLGRVAGLRPIENCGDIENLDCTELVGGHLLYREAIPKLMKEAGFLVISEEFNEMEDPDPDRQRERQIQLYEEIEEAKKLVAQEEAEAVKTGKKVKRKTARKSGFLGLWGKEIQTKPTNLNAESAKSHAAPPTETYEYDPFEEKKPVSTAETKKSPTVEAKEPPTVEKETLPSKFDAKDDNVLFDVDKMREELTANGVTITSLESTLPPLVLTSPSPVPVLQRASTTPVPLAVHRTHSPSLPVIKDPSRLDTWDIQPRNITPNQELEKLVIDTKKVNGWKPSLQETGCNDEPEITMSFAPESPETTRHATLGAPYMHNTHSISAHTLGDKTVLKLSPSLSNLPIEKNVWDDDDIGSGGDITMSFE